MATWPVVSGNPVPSTNINELNQRVSNTVEAIGTDAVNTAETRSSTSYGDLATVGPSVTVTLPSGSALVMWSAQMLNQSAGGRSHMSVAVTGASTQAANDQNVLGAESNAGGDIYEMGTIRVYTGLSTGSNTFTAKYRVVTSGTTGRWHNRTLVVFPLGG